MQNADNSTQIDTPPSKKHAFPGFCRGYVPGSALMVAPTASSVPCIPPTEEALQVGSEISPHHSIHALRHSFCRVLRR
jgi:hypothetical protein